MAARASWRTPISKAPTPSAIRRSSAAATGCTGCSASSPGRTAFRATSRRKRRARSTRAASSAIRWLHAYGAAFDNPDLIVACVVGDGEAETGAARGELAFQQVPEPGARRRGAADPASQRLQDRQSDRAGAHRPRGADRPAARLRPRAALRRGRRPGARAPAARRRRSTRSLARIREIQARARGRPTAPSAERPRWPMIVFRTPKGWTGPKFVDGKPVEGTWRAHQVPIADFKNPEHLQQLEDWLKSYRPRRAVRRARQVPRGVRRARADRPSPHGLEPARQRRRAAAAAVDAAFPRLRRRGAAARRASRPKRRACSAAFLRDVMKLNLDNAQFPPVRPRRDRLEPARGGLRGLRQGMDGRDRGRRRRPQPPTAASWRC